MAPMGAKAAAFLMDDHTFFVSLVVQKSQL